MYNPDLKLYATAAMQAMLGRNTLPFPDPEALAKRAFDYAEAMVKEAQKREEAKR